MFLRGINNYTNGIALLQTAQPDAEKLAAILQTSRANQEYANLSDEKLQTTMGRVIVMRQK